jgi:hypothetical protein
VDAGSLLAGGGHGIIALGDHARQTDRLGVLAVADDRDQAPLAGSVEDDIGDVDDLRGVGVIGGGAGGERGVGLEAFDPSRERALGGPSAAGGSVDRDLGVRDLVAIDGEDAEPEPVLPDGEGLAGR